MIPDNFYDPLVEEVLMDAAENFFGARRQLDGIIDLFQSFVEAVRKKEADIAVSAGFLNYLLLDGMIARDFYEAIHINSPAVLLEGQLSDKTVPDQTPFAFTVKGEFTRFVLQAYDDLQQACNEYIHGKPDDGSRLEKNDAYYNLLMNMCDLINEKVRHVNTNMSPRSVLQFARRFDAEAEGKENIIGGMVFGGDGINEKLAYHPIDFDSLQLKKYPELPKQEQVVSKITSFCKKSYSGNKNEIRQRVSDVKEKIRSFQTRLDSHIS
ncbi:hypothetical protein QUF72_21210 [Desulfobacterales bacterium HSG2]|nr:hypothetical protein [Desulfobacterales bacterium HSG2]